MDEVDIIELEQVLDHCVSYNCDGCPFDWMEDHGLACYRVFAKASIDYIKGLKVLLDTYDRKIDELLEVFRK